MLYALDNVVKSRPGEQGYSLCVKRLRIKKGARLALLGPSGCGKSTTLDLLGLVLRPDSSQGFIFRPDGEAEKIDALWRRQEHEKLAALRLRYMGYVLQSGELIPYLTCGENMLLTARLGGIAGDEAEQTARGLAKVLGVEKLWSSPPNTCSVGERQRVAIVRALASRPAVILADEPTAALDPLHADRVMDSFLEALSETGATLILATHNESWARRGALDEVEFRLVADENGTTALLDDGGADV